MSTLSSESIRDLALSVYETVFRETESFHEQTVGTGLAYILGAILRNNPNDALHDCENDRSTALLNILRDAYPPENPVWAFVRRESSDESAPSPVVHRPRKKEHRAEFHPLDDALCRCCSIEAKSLEEFLDTLLDQDLEVLAQLPGTPGQVLAAQFTCYARSSVELTESLKRDKAHSQTLIETLYRLPEVKKRRRN